MGALTGVKALEFAGIGPGPFCCMLLADMGAEIVRIERTAMVGNDLMEPKYNPMLRGRKSIALDLKKPDGVEVALKLCEWADITIECFRPGVMERLGLGPDVVMERNPGLVYGRMTGWGQTGPLASAPGHDLNYVALTGALHAIGTRETPVPPLVMVGDFGGGAMYLAVGVLSAYIESLRSGKGQVVDAAVVDGAASLMTAFYGMLAAGNFVEERASNRLDGGSHFYSVYPTKDEQFISIASTEPEFFAQLMAELNLDVADYDQADRDNWPVYQEKLKALFKTKSRAEWCALLEDKGVCFSPVLSMSEAASHPHNQARENFMEVLGVEQPAPAPKFSRTKSKVEIPAVHAGEHTAEVLSQLGFDQKAIVSFLNTGVACQR